MNKLIKLAAGVISLALLAPVTSADSDQKLPTVWQQTIKVSSNQALDLTAQHPFTAYAIELDQSQAELYFKTNQDDNWRLVEPDLDQEATSAFSNLYLIRQDEATKFSYRFGPGELPADFTVHFFNTKSGDSTSINTADLTATTDFAVNHQAPAIISRSQWGADESLRLKTEDDKEAITPTATSQKVLDCQADQQNYPEYFALDRVVKYQNGQELTWPLEYSKRIHKIVLHHTAKEAVSDDRSPIEVIRAIYAYHAVSRGWGDIGYNFLIDPYGNIYEGRAGGDYVVGGHAYCRNIGTIGIALMGNFQTEEPTAAQISTLKQLLPSLAQKYDLDLTATEEFVGEITPNLQGHRDLAATSCPGENLYNKFSELRQYLLQTSAIKQTKLLNYSAELFTSLSTISLDPGEKKSVKLQFKNTGNTTWSQGTWLYSYRSNPETLRVNSPVSGQEYVAALLQEDSVSPGQIGTFNLNLEAGYNSGLFSLELTPVIANKKVASAAIILASSVKEPNWQADLEKVNLYPSTVQVGQDFTVAVQLKNSSNVTWKPGVISLYGFARGNNQKLVAELSTIVNPGEIGTFRFNFDPLLDAGESDLLFQLYANSQRLSAIPIIVHSFEVSPNTSISVSAPASEPQPQVAELAELSSVNYAAQHLTDRNILSFTTIKNPVYSYGKFVNTGSQTWQRGDVKLYIYRFDKRAVIDFNENTVSPGEIATFDLDYIPEVTGSQRFTLVVKAGNTKITENTQWIVNTLSFEPTASLRRKETYPLESFVLATYDQIRIKLGFEGKVVKIAAGDNPLVIADGQRVVGALGGEDAITLVQDQNKVYLLNNQTNYNTVKIYSTAATTEIVNWERYPAWDQNKRWNDNLFRGALELRVYNGELTVINELNLEDYLRGMAESPDADPKEKRKAMAILARTYAAFYLNSANVKFPGAPFDGSDNPDEFQKYLGERYAIRSNGWSEAVEQTFNQVVKYQGKLIKTPYFHQSDGRTRSAEEVWGWQDTPYLQSVADPTGIGKELKGHGVGLSGVGAKQLANEGKTASAIIKYYYQGVTIGSLYY
jgi:hypothetical protein